MLEQRIQLLENLLGEFIYSDRYIVQRDMEFLDGRNIQTSTDTGTKIGTGTDQKIGFFDATPVAQQIGANSLSESGSDSDALCRAQVNKIRTALINLGLTN